MLSLRIRFTKSDKSFLEKAVLDYNRQSSAEKLRIHTDTLLLPYYTPDLFFRDFLNEVPTLSRERIRRDFVRGLKQFIKRNLAGGKVKEDHLKICSVTKSLALLENNLGSLN